MENASTFNTSTTPLSENLQDHEQVKMPARLLISELLKTRDKTSLQVLLQGKFRKTFNYHNFEILLQKGNKTRLELFMSFDPTQEPAVNGGDRRKMINEYKIAFGNFHILPQ
jgi:hypothetical protein